MATISRTKTWAASETLTASDLNAEFDNIIATANGNLNAANLGVTAGVAAASKALVLDASRDLDHGTAGNQIRNLSIAGNAAVGGNLTVTGTSTFNGGTITLGDAAGDTVTIGGTIQGNLIFEGSTANAYELTLAPADVTADRTLTMPDASDTLVGRTTTDTLTNKTITSATLNTPTITGATTFSDGSYNFNIASHDGTYGLALAGTVVTSSAAELNILDGVTATAAEINLIDGDTARGTNTVGTGDGILINDSGTMRMTNVDTVSTYFASHSVGGTSIVTVGTVGTGTWQGTAVTVPYGGTGASSLTDGGVLLGSGTGAVTAMAVLADGELIVGDGTTDPVAESGATLRTSIGVGTGDSPQFTGIELSHATANTLTGSGGVLSIEGVEIPTISSSHTFTNKTWNGVAVTVAYGGTGATSLTDGGVLLGSGTGAVTAMAALADGAMIVGDGSTDPVAESGATLRTSVGVGTGDSPQFTGIELSHATDNTLTASSGILSIESVAIPTISSTHTLTNKTWNGAVIASAYLDSDTAHLGVTQTFTGAKTFTNTVTVGANDAGHDVILYGDTASANITWDTSVDDLIANGAARIIVPDGQMVLGSTAISSTAAEINLLDALSRGSILYGNASGATAVLTKGGSGTVLTSDGTDISWGAAAGGGHTIQEEGSGLTQRANLNFVGAAVTATDNSGADTTIVTIGSTAASMPLTRSDGSTSDPIALSSAAIGDSLVTDTSPQLGGNLDVNGQSIVSDGSNENIPITPHGTGSVVISKLSVTGDTSLDGGSFVFNDAGADKDFRIEGDSEANLFFADASTDRIGIGTAAPGGKLSIYDSTAADYTALRIYQGGDTDYYWDFTADVDAGDLVIGGNHSSFDLILNPTQGNVGIGTTAPTYPLDVQGTVASMFHTKTVHGSVTGLNEVKTFASSSPADGDLPWQIDVTSKDSAGSLVNYAQIAVFSSDLNSSARSSYMRFVVYNGGSAYLPSLSSTGVWTDASGEAGKEYEGTRQEVWPDGILSKIKNLRVSKYHGANHPKNKPINETHVSPTAEDFWDALEIGEDPRAEVKNKDNEKINSPGIAAKDLAGVALVAVQELLERVEALEAA